ncbi:regulatory protein RecX [Amycolatopsis sp. FDAARGOS 1241]|uniref:regulatory protein RecX n=1 Tax=Amycolatopsis sp. FDAARGOS 1241 TaxID=2778070 RepID=UPI00194FB73D|nr:regulatory protein RecX [Amycolatopsis sp. FDAARGOS 1241]QRP44114.1 regulatory protein RecX [Amycolatopsis sp. FDAARGOS 1241]
MARAPKVEPAELPPEERAKKAKEICFDLLAIRARTVEELRQTLRRKGFDSDTIETLLGKLDRAGLVNDAEFAEMWVKARHSAKGLSRTALVAELRRKGVDEEIAVQAAGEVDRESEEERARELVRKRLGSLGNVDEQTAIRRLLGFLARKGYPQGLAYTVIRDELREYGATSTLLDDATID